jgi:hypothetical protein
MASYAKRLFDKTVQLLSNNTPEVTGIDFASHDLEIRTQAIICGGLAN